LYKTKRIHTWPGIKGVAKLIALWEALWLFMRLMRYGSIEIYRFFTMTSSEPGSNERPIASDLISK
jgi:hypothetical protein